MNKIILSYRNFFLRRYYGYLIYKSAYFIGFEKPRHIKMVFDNYNIKEIIIFGSVYFNFKYCYE